MGYLRRASLLSNTRIKLQNGRYDIGSYRISSHYAPMQNILDSSSSLSSSEEEESVSLGDISLRGAGQVIFMNSDLAGKIIFGSLLIGDPVVASMALLGTATSSVTAKLSGLNRDLTTAGQYSYNGCLMGCATAVFISPHNLLNAVPITMLGASASTYMTVYFSKALQVQWTFVFNLASLTALLLLPPSESLASSTIVSTSVASNLDLVLIPFTGLSQIFMVQSAYTGMGLLAALATFSPSLASRALLGSTVGSLTGLAMGVDLSELATGVWGYNAALTSMGVAVCFLNTWQSKALGVAGAAATTVLFGALQSTMGDAPYLNLSFCTVMTLCWWLGTPLNHHRTLIQGLFLAPEPHSPELNNSPIPARLLRSADSTQSFRMRRKASEKTAAKFAATTLPYRRVYSQSSLLER